MRATRRVRLGSAVLLAAASIGAYAAVVSTTAASGDRHRSESVTALGTHPSVDRFNLDGYVITTSYTRGRNTGNTFRQTYGISMVQGVPIKGPFVGTTFPPEDYVAMPIAHDQLYVAWLDPTTFAIVDAFVMNFQTHIVFDYAPGSAHPESAGTVRLERVGSHPLP